MSPSSTPQAGTPEMKARVPSIGSMIHDHSLAPGVKPCSSPWIGLSGQAAPEPGADQRLDAAVGLGDRIEGAVAELVLDGDGLAEELERQPPGVLDDRQRDAAAAPPLRSQGPSSSFRQKPR